MEDDGDCVGVKRRSAVISSKDVLREWGARKLEHYWKVNTSKKDWTIDRDTVKVGIDHESGYSCCPGCEDGYCYGESARVFIAISGYVSRDGQVDKKGRVKKGQLFSMEIDQYSFDLVEFLDELEEIRNG